MPADQILDANTLLDAATRKTSLSDWGDNSLPERFAIAVEQLKQINLSEDSQQKAAEVCHWLLTDRLRFFNDHKTIPALSEEVIERPLFATGEPRSGTTLLHVLLSVDPDSRSLRFWEVMYPSPPPGMAEPDDPRKAKADDDWREINTMAPEWLKLHPYNDMLGDGLPECERTWAFDFRAMTPTAWWRAGTGMFVGGTPTDPDAQYRIHKMMLQHCQHGQPKKRWALKGFHGPRLKSFFDTYPDARMIWTHRDPIQVAASRIAMAITLTKAFSAGRPVNEQALIKAHLAASRTSFQDTMNNPLIDDPRIFHVRYKDFIADPVATIGQFYEFAGLSLTTAAQQAMRDYLANNRGDRHGKFRYSLDTLGMDTEQLSREFAPYCEKFGLHS